MFRQVFVIFKAFVGALESTQSVKALTTHEDGNQLLKQFGVNLNYMNKSTSSFTRLLVMLHHYYKMFGTAIKRVYQLFIVFKKAYELLRWEVLYNILIVWYPDETGKANKNYV
jgi:hypothetical protein